MSKLFNLFCNNLVTGFNQSSFETFDGRSSSKNEAVISLEGSNEVQIISLENDTDDTTSLGTENRQLKSFLEFVTIKDYCFKKIITSNIYPFFPYRQL